MNKILVTYFTRQGSTREVAEIISGCLQENGFSVAVLPMDSVVSLNEFDTVIIGAPINGMRWVPEAVEFVDSFLPDLVQKETALFCLSYVYFTGNDFWKGIISKALNGTAEKIQSRQTGVFGGRLEESIPAPMRFIFGIEKDAPLSLMNEGAIRDWVKELIAVSTAGGSA